MAFENAYTIPHIEVEGFPCKTNITSNTAFRGYGSSQAMLVMENIMDTVADKLGKPVMEVCEEMMFYGVIAIIGYVY